MTITYLQVKLISRVLKPVTTAGVRFAGPALSSIAGCYSHDVVGRAAEKGGLIQFISAAAKTSLMPG